jgi:hypothetical protein
MQREMEALIAAASAAQAAEASRAVAETSTATLAAAPPVKVSRGSSDSHAACRTEILEASAVQVTLLLLAGVVALSSSRRDTGVSPGGQ